MGVGKVIADIFGAGDVIEKGFELIDDMHTSEVEAIEAKAKAKTDLLSAYAPFKKAQRLLAAMFSVTFLLCFVLVLTMSLFGEADVAVVREVISEFYIGEIMLTIVVFYFGGGFIEGAAGKIKK
tara:strand:- start:474 stop:845 length:372 start_codon:yes stop_codon:yes gene_type:complete